MRTCLLLLLLVSTVEAAPVAGLAPVKKAHIETTANAHISAVSTRLLGVGRLGISEGFDAGLALGLGLGDASGVTVGVPSRWLVLSQQETSGIARITTDFWLGVTQASPEIHTSLSATGSASHARRIMGLPLELRLTTGMLVLIQDHPDLKDTTDFYPIILGGIGGWIYEGWQCSLEGGLGAGSGQINVEASLQF